MKQFLLLFTAIIIMFFTRDICGARNIKVYSSVYLLAPDTVIVYTPANNNTGLLPAVILLHGWSGSYKQWEQIADLQYYADKYQIAVVCPDGFYDSWYINSPEKKGQNYAEFFHKELYSQIVKEYQLDSNRICISGLSMGGFGAVSLFFDNPSRFIGAGSMSGILDIVSFPNKWGMKNVLGDFTQYPERYLNATPIERITNVTTGDKLILFDCGREDFAYSVNEGFAKACEKMKVNFVFISQPGKHDREYWRKSLDVQMLYFMREIGKVSPRITEEDEK